MTPTEIKAAAIKKAESEAAETERVNDGKRAECREQGESEAAKHWEALRAKIDAEAENGRSECTHLMTDQRKIGGCEYLQAVLDSFQRRCSEIGVQLSGRVEYNTRTLYVGSPSRMVGYEFVNCSMRLTLKWD